MHKPFRHPKTGIFWVKGSVPAEVRAHPAYRGPKQFNRSLATRNPKEVEAALARVLLGLRGKWAEQSAANERAGDAPLAPLTLSDAQVMALARRWHDERLLKEERQDQHEESLLAVLSVLEGQDASDAAFTRNSLIAEAADALLRSEGLECCDKASRNRLHGELRRLHKELYRLLLRRAGGSCGDAFPATDKPAVCSAHTAV